MKILKKAFIILGASLMACTIHAQTERPLVRNALDECRTELIAPLTLTPQEVTYLLTNALNKTLNFHVNGEQLFQDVKAKDILYAPTSTQSVPHEKIQWANARSYVLKSLGEYREARNRCLQFMKLIKGTTADYNLLLSKLPATTASKVIVDYLLEKGASLDGRIVETTMTLILSGPKRGKKESVEMHNYTVLHGVINTVNLQVDTNVLRGPSLRTDEQTRQNYVRYVVSKVKDLKLLNAYSHMDSDEYMTPLMIAVKSGDDPLINALLDMGVSPKQKYVRDEFSGRIEKMPIDLYTGKSALIIGRLSGDALTLRRPSVDPELKNEMPDLILQ